MPKKVINAKELDKFLIKSISNSPTNLSASFRAANRVFGYNVNTIKAHYQRVLRKKGPIFMIRTATGIAINTKVVHVKKETAKGFKLVDPYLKLKGLTNAQKIELFDMLIA